MIKKSAFSRLIVLHVTLYLVILSMIIETLLITLGNVAIHNNARDRCVDFLLIGTLRGIDDIFFQKDTLE